jgi:hypothetical protein
MQLFKYTRIWTIGRIPEEGKIACTIDKNKKGVKVNVQITEESHYYPQYAKCMII